MPQILLEWHRRPSRQAGRLAVPGSGCGELWLALLAAAYRLPSRVAHEKRQKRRQPPSKTGCCQQKRPNMREVILFAKDQEQKIGKTALGPCLWRGT